MCDKFQQRVETDEVHRHFVLLSGEDLMPCSGVESFADTISLSGWGPRSACMKGLFKSSKRLSEVSGRAAIQPSLQWYRALLEWEQRIRHHVVWFGIGGVL
jgi:hypothetical protein